MDWSETIRAGMKNELVFQVTEKHLASHVGSGSMRVLATPAMIAFMETTSMRLLAQYLPQGYSSVGVNVNVSHLAPALLGAEVRVRAEVVRLEGIQVELAVEAWDHTEKLGEGTHRRVIIDEVRFMKRLSTKSAATQAAKDN